MPAFLRVFWFGLLCAQARAYSFLVVRLLMKGCRKASSRHNYSLGQPSKTYRQHLRIQSEALRCEPYLLVTAYIFRLSSGYLSAKSLCLLKVLGHHVFVDYGRTLKVEDADVSVMPDILVIYSESNRRKNLLIAASLILALAIVDWRTTPYLSLGFLFMFTFLLMHRLCGADRSLVSSWFYKQLSVPINRGSFARHYSVSGIGRTPKRLWPGYGSRLIPQSQGADWPPSSWTFPKRCATASNSVWISF